MPPGLRLRAPGRRKTAVGQVNAGHAATSGSSTSRRSAGRRAGRGLPAPRTIRPPRRPGCETSAASGRRLRRAAETVPPPGGEAGLDRQPPAEDRLVKGDSVFLLSIGGPATARFARRSTRGVLLGFSAWRLAAVGAAVGDGGSGFGAAGGGAACSSGWSSPCRSWRRLRSFGRRPARGGMVADRPRFAGRKAGRPDRVRAKIDRPRPAGTLALPGDAAALRFHRPCVRGVHGARPAPPHALRGVACQPPGVSAARPRRPAGRVAAWGRVLAGLAPSGTCAGIQITESTIPDSGRGYRRVLRPSRGAERGVGRRAVRDAAGRQLGRGLDPSHDHHPRFDMKAAGRQIKASAAG